MTRAYQDNGAVYRVTINRLYADGSGSYLSNHYGPYSSLATARSQASRRYREATTESRKAAVHIERAETVWMEVS